MLEKGKRFVKEHKKELIVGGFVLAAGVFIGMKMDAKKNAKVIELGKNLLGKSSIVWTPNSTSMPIERVKQILDLNANNGSMYAIFREGPDPNAYVCIMLDETLIIPELV